MTREEAIDVIIQTYAADAAEPFRAHIGELLLARAKAEVLGWRAESTAVLVRYAALCLERREHMRQLAEREHRLLSDPAARCRDTVDMFQTTTEGDHDG